jgi:putative salt-induced outer membrane protein YdiY
MQVSWRSIGQQVSQIATQGTVLIMLDDNTELTGILSAAENAELRVATGSDDAGQAVSMTRVAAINPPEVPKLKISGHANAGIDLDRGNTDQDSYHADVESIFRWVSDRVTVTGSGDLEKSNGDKTKQQATLIGKYDHFFDGQWYVYGGAGFEHDKFADLDLRSGVSLGAGYQIFENDRTNLSIEAGPSYVWEDFDEGEDQDYAAARWALRADHFLWSAWKLQAFHNHSLNWSLEDSSDYLFRSQTGLRIPIMDRLQATAQFNFDRDNSPADTAKKNDYEYLLTGGYTW